jgi:hypothetical protein
LVNFSNFTSNSGSPIFNNIHSYVSIQQYYTGIPNFICKLAPVASHINIKLLGELSQGFHDTQILDLIQYGFPLDLDKSSFIPNLAVTNHGSALQFPAEVDSYFREETHFGAMLGPFPDPPFPDLHCSPLMTAPKDGSKRRIIVDMSFPSPSGHSVNLSVNKHSYVGTPFSLRLPTVDTICQVLNIMGKNTKIFKVDLARAFRQLHLDPFDVKYMGLRWGGAYYVDTSVPFGYVHGTQACVRVTDLIRYILSRMGIFVLNYIDDIIGFAPDDVAESHFQLTVGTLLKLGFNLNNSKTVAPTSGATCLGIYFDIKIGFIQIPHIKLQEVLSLCKIYFSKSKITKKQLQALLGSLMFLHKAIKPARLFVNRILALLRDMGEAASIAIDEGCKQDLQWFMACAHAVNGTVSFYKCVRPRLDIFVDASLHGLGGALGARVYTHTLTPRPGWSIAHWEAINVFVALQVFAPLLRGRVATIWCDSRVAVSVLHSGRGSDPILHCIARNVWLLLSGLDCDIEFRHIPGHLNQVADLLSRWSSARHPTASLFRLLNQVPLWCPVPDDALSIQAHI